MLDDSQLFGILERELIKLKHENEGLKQSLQRKEMLSITDLEETVKELSLIILNSVEN